MPITSKSHAIPFMKELDKIYNISMMEHPSEYDKIFKVRNADAGPYESQGEMSGLALPEGMAEGDSVNYVTPEEGNIVRRTFNWSGNGYIITRQALDDELHGQLRGLPKALAKSMRIYADIKAFELFNTADDTSLSKDGAALVGSAGHTLLNDVLGYGTFYNSPATAGDLSETTFKEAMDYYDNIVDETSYPLALTPSKLLCSRSDKYVAHRLHTQMYGGSSDDGGLGQTGSDPSVDNMLNIANPENGFVNGWSVFDSYWLDDDRWFMLSDDHDAQFVWKVKPEQKSEYEFDTENTKFKAIQRFGVWANEYRGIYGNITGVSHS